MKARLMSILYGLVALAVSLSFIGLKSALAEREMTYDSVIVGTGIAAVDVPAVQNAVFSVGSILLKGTFDFGTLGSVIITKDVAISGETDTKGTPLTKIKNGFWTFFSPLATGSYPPPKIKIQGIHFDGALWAPIHIAYSSGATITGNHITNIRPRGPLPGPFKYLQAGVIMGTIYATGGYTELIEGALTGDLIVRGNYIDMGNHEPGDTLGQGIFCNLTWGAVIEVSDNVVENASRNGIECLDNYTGPEGNGAITIRNNMVVTPDEGFPLPNAPSTPNGIVAGWFYNSLGATDPDIYSGIIIEHNYIRQGEAVLCFGINVLSSEAVILDNHILVGGGDNAKGIILCGVRGVIANNKIEGSGQYALVIAPFPPAPYYPPIIPAYENRAFGNNLNNFDVTAGGAHVRFAPYSYDNTLLGGKGTVLNEGTNNIIKGNYEIFP